MLDTAHKRALAAEVLASFGAARLPVTGSSMFPALCPGDLLDLRRPDVIQDGDIVVFERHGQFVAHRVVSQTSATIVTRGDRLRFPTLPSPPPKSSAK